VKGVKERALILAALLTVGIAAYVSLHAVIEVAERVESRAHHPPEGGQGR
jgi:hypothetical protein